MTTRRPPSAVRGLLLLFVLLLAGSAVLLAGIFAVAGERDNAIAVESSRLLAQNVLDAARRSLAATALDYAYWDDAVDNLQYPVDTDWTAENFAAYLHRTWRISGVLVFDADGRLIYRERHGEPVDTATAGPVSPTVMALVNAARAPHVLTYEAVSGVVEMDGLPALAAAVVITPNSTARAESAPPPAESGVLVFARALDRAMVDELAGTYNLPGLALADRGAARGAAVLDLVTRDGRTVGALAWNPVLPAGSLLRGMTPPLVAWSVVSLLLGALFLRQIDRTASRVQQGEDRFRDFAEMAAEYFWETDASGHVTFRSDRFGTATGLPGGVVVGDDAEVIIDELSADRHAEAAFARHIAERRPFRDLEVRRRLPEGTVRVLRCAGTPAFDRHGRYVGFRFAATDVTEQRRLADELTFQASHDALTRLFNRRGFQQRLEAAIASSRLEQAHHVLCYIDLDRFKAVNDCAGHAAGDELLRQLAETLRARVRRHDTVARIGGDEFVLLLEHCEAAEGERIAEEVREAVAALRFEWQGSVFRVAASVGVARVQGAEVDADVVLSAVDRACYRAKDAGGDRIHRGDIGELAAQGA